MYGVAIGSLFFVYTDAGDKLRRHEVALSKKFYRSCQIRAVRAKGLESIFEADKIITRRGICNDKAF